MLSGNKREEDRGEEITDVMKRAKHQFNVDDFLSEVLGEYFDDEEEDDQLREFIDKVEQIATLIAEAASTNHFDDDRTIKNIILKLATSHLANFHVFLPNPFDPKHSLATYEQVLIHQLEDRMDESLSRMGYLIDYLTKFKEHNPLATVFAARKNGKVSNANELMVILLRLVKETYMHGEVTPPEYFSDYIAIGSFLLNNTLVESYLDELEKLLQQHAAAKNIPELKKQDDGRLIFLLQSPETNKRYKILSEVICAWSKENGFAAQAKIISLLSHPRFLGLLSSLTLLKDKAVAAGEFHGAWSHAIQWFCLMEHQKRTGFLRNSPLDLYKVAGPVWNDVFDLLGDKDYSCAPHVTHRMYCPDALDRWPLLAGSITRIYNKMHLSGIDYPKHLREKCGEVAYAQGYQMRPL